MLEKYFLPSVRLRWTYPGFDSSGKKDGSIIANPERGTSEMRYDGLDGELLGLFDPSLPNTPGWGLSKGAGVPYNWLFYSVGHTTKTKLGGYDVLTGFMSGCLITKWIESGSPYIGHIGTSDTEKEVNAKVKSTFAETMPPDTTGFNPYAAWDNDSIIAKWNKFKVKPVPKFLGLVTARGEFYSILLFGFGNKLDEWCVGGKILVPAMNRQELYIKLNPEGGGT